MKPQFRGVPVLCYSGLVDETMSVTGDLAATSTWDAFIIPLSLTTTEAKASVYAGRSGALPLTIPLAGKPDRIVQMPRHHNEYCFAAMAGNQRVVGLTWRHAISGNAQLTTDSRYDNCVYLTAYDTPAQVTLTVQLGELTATFPLTVEPISGRPIPTT